MSHYVVHLSDLHICAEGEPEEDAAARIVDGICARFEAATDRTVVLITGDLANDGRESQFIRARELLDPLYTAGFSVVPIPGNHDYGPRGLHADKRNFERFKQIFFGNEDVTYPSIAKLGRHTLIGLNTMAAECGFGDGLLADGELGNAQRMRLLEILEGLENRPPEQKVIIHLHHHPFHYTDEGIVEFTYEWIGHRLKDGARFMDEIAGKADILLFGHEHRHLDFSNTTLARRFNIPVVLSAGKSTKISKEFKVQANGNTDKGEILHEGLLCRVIKLRQDGDIHVETVAY